MSKYAMVGWGTLLIVVHGVTHYALPNNFFIGLVEGFTFVTGLIMLSRFLFGVSREPRHQTTSSGLDIAQ